MKGLIKRAALRAGYEISRAGSTDRSGTMEQALERIAGHCSVSTILDVGASDGRWSLDAQRWYPDAAFILFEAQAGPHGDALNALSAADPRMNVVLAAAGAAPGETHFDATDPFGGVASAKPTGEHDIVVPVTTVDTEVARLELPGPYLLKLDTHGFEVPILDGAAATLEQASVLVIEAYNFRLQPTALRFHELCGLLAQKGFAVFDMADVTWRPRDGALWQMDLFFVRDDDPAFSSASYV